MKRRRLIGGLLALTMLLTAAGCGTQTEGELAEKLAMDKQHGKLHVLDSLPEGTAALELVEVGQDDSGYYMDCWPHDADAVLLSNALCRLPLSEGVWISYYPMGVDGSRGESFGGAEYVYSNYQIAEEQMEGVWFWTYDFDEDGALCSLSDEIPRELIVQERPVEDFYGCWDYSGSFWQPGLEMYNVPGEPPCGDYIVLHEDWTAEIYRLEENTVYLADWEMWESSAYIEALDIFLSFTDTGLEDSNGHYGDPGTAPSTENMEYVDLT